MEYHLLCTQSILNPNFLMFIFNQTISQAINNQNILHQRIIELIVQMDHALSFAEDINVVLNKLKSSEDVLVDLLTAIADCFQFIQSYSHRHRGSPGMSTCVLS